jgi:hypothetical protein
MKLLAEPLVDLPKNLADTELYKILKLFDDEILKRYQFRFKKDDEFPVIKSTLEYFYKFPEKLDDGTPDIDAKNIDINYLTWIVQSGKSTREFSRIIFGGNFNLTTEGNNDEEFLENFVKIDPENHMNIIVTLKEITGDNLENSKGSIENMLNHLLYFHNISSWAIEIYTQIVEIYQKDRNSYFLRNINAIYYDCDNGI